MNIKGTQIIKLNKDKIKKYLGFDNYYLRIGGLPKNFYHDFVHISNLNAPNYINSKDLLLNVSEFEIDEYEIAKGLLLKLNVVEEANLAIRNYKNLDCYEYAEEHYTVELGDLLDKALDEQADKFITGLNTYDEDGVYIVFDVTAGGTSTLLPSFVKFEWAA